MYYIFICYYNIGKFYIFVVIFIIILVVIYKFYWLYDNGSDDVVFYIVIVSIFFLVYGVFMGFLVVWIMIFDDEKEDEEKIY